eukprot:537678_1
MNEKDIKQMSYCQILDKIHCHYQHSYDIGYKLGMAEKDQILHNINEQKSTDDDEQFCINPTLIDISKILKPKHEEYNSYKHNKFSQLYDTYSFGFRFNYWDYHKNCDNINIAGLPVRDCYVPNKYSSLKEELTQNTVIRITYLQFQNELAKANQFKQTNYCKTIRSFVLPFDVFHSNKHFGIPNDTEIFSEHLLAIIIYCAYTNLQFEFSKSYRGENPDDNLYQVKQVHSNFHHFGRLLRECVELFGKRQDKDETRIFYHGTSKKFTFKNTSALIFGPLSTTSVWEVAVCFSNYQGLILELYPHWQMPYFDCCWLSDFSNEGELLFVGGKGPMVLLNITDANIGNDYRIFTTALGIIDTMLEGYYFESDRTVSELVNTTALDLPLKVLQNRAAPIKDIVKYFVIKLMKHELNRYEPKKYHKYAEIPPYIDELLHMMCVNRDHVCIDWKAMNVHIAERYDHVGCGYQGYLFLKDIICHKDKEWINLKLINELLPNLDYVALQGVCIVSSFVLDEILLFLSQHPKSLIEIIKIAPYSLDIGLMAQTLGLLVEKYLKSFLEINWMIGCQEYNNTTTDSMHMYSQLSIDEKPIKTIRRGPCICMIKIMLESIDTAKAKDQILSFSKDYINSLQV